MKPMRKVHADISEDQVKDVSLGDEVEIVTRGKVCELRAPYEYDTLTCGCPTEKGKGKEKMKEEKQPHSMTVDVISTTVREVKANNSVPPDDEGED